MKRILLWLPLFLGSFLLFPQSSHAQQIPTDAGRLSLIQVENGQIVNQRDGSSIVSSQGLNIVPGRTPYRNAISVPFANGGIQIPITNNFNYIQGTVSFWINSSVWNDTLTHTFFKVNAYYANGTPSRDFVIFKEYGSSGSIVRAGIDPDFISIPANPISNGWHLLTFTYQSGINTHFYIDGNLAGISAGPYDGGAYPALAGNCSTLICWGTWLFNDTGAQSVMEDMQTLNYPLTQQQIFGLYSSSVPVQFYFHAPTVGTITAPTTPQLISTTITASAPFTDLDPRDTHIAVWDWGDGSTSSGTLTESNGSGSVSNIHTYTTAGVYTVTLTITDNTGLSGSNVFQYIVVYNPNGGFVTAGGFFDSPTVSYTANPSASGRTKIGINAKYIDGVLQGSLKLNFKNGNLEFISSGSDWLVVTSGNTAQYQGTGAINGIGSYIFQATIVDNSATNTAGTVQVKIFNGTTVIYDSQIQPLAGGFATVHL